MKKIYTDAGYTWQNTEKVKEGEQIMGRICVADEDGFVRVEKVGVGKVPKLIQYINIFELIAVARSIEIAIEKGWTGSLEIYTDSQVAVGWASKGKIKNKRIETQAHTSALEYLRTARKNYIGSVSYNYVPRDYNLAGHVLEKELEKDKTMLAAKQAQEEPESENSDYVETPSAIDVINWWLNFFKPYFQEKMHEEAVEELEKMDAFMKTYDVDNVSK